MSTAAAPLRLLITGCKGRMGQALIAAATAEPLAEPHRTIDLGDPLPPALDACQTVIDFSHHSFATELINACLERKTPLVIGTTGHTDAELALIHAAAQHISIVKAGNYSIGVNTLFWLTRKAAEILGPSFDLEVLEMHHNKKIDAPSGTARRLVEVLTEVRDLDYKKHVAHGREGNIGARPPQEIGLHAIRGGDVIGDHTVIYAAQGERVELTHKASSREIFATGAVRAALWLRGKAPGLYDMEDVLGLR
jgi:4-hydroxy-tetrahydrodipicolinate reductase